ncbi:hypothetical protein VTO42DRAFT_1541 [Malbranchea cinnamomea]
MAFANSTYFTTNPATPYEPFKPISEIRSMFSPDAKLLIAIGGWGDTQGLSLGATNKTTQELYARNVAEMLKTHGFDGVDIDWEYPGGNGQDYRQAPNEEKSAEIETYPQLLAAIRAAIGKEKLLSIAVPGREVDMIAYNREQSPKIWPSVDFVNVMTYDLMNRRDKVTMHHTDVAGSLKTIEKYICLGLAPEKINLGFAFYAKWFTTDPNSNCAEKPLGCDVVPLENKDGSDNGKSGVITFEKRFMNKPKANLTESPDASCGEAAGFRCPAGHCCSADGYCGDTEAHCGMNCMSGYGECRVNITAVDSWRTALEKGQADTEAGGQYYWDSAANLFWTWDTPEHMEQKFEKIVKAKGLGGIMAWSLGEDSFDWSHLATMQKMHGQLQEKPSTCAAKV